MATTNIVVNSPISFIINSTDLGYPLFTVDVTTGVVTSTVLTALATAYMTEHIQKVMALDPTISVGAVASVARSLLVLKQAEGSFTGAFSVVGPAYTFDLSGLAALSHLLVSIAMSTSSPFDSAEAGGSPGGGGSAAAPDTSVQFNNGGAFAGSSKFTFEQVNSQLLIGGNVQPPGIPPGSTFILAQSDNLGGIAALSNSFFPAVISGAKSDGTLAVPLSVADGDFLVIFTGTGWGSDNLPDTQGAGSMIVRVDGAPQAGYVPSQLLFSTKPVGGGPGPVAPVTRMTIRGDGFVGINTDTRVQAEVFGCAGGILTTGAVWMGNEDKTGTPGNVTINKPTGRAAIANGASTVTILNSFVQAGDTIMVTGLGPTVTPIQVDNIGAGTFDVVSPVPVPADSPFMFLVIKATP